MKLVSAQVTSFKSIDDCGVVEIGDVTCLVGKNESGKTAFLQALYNLNPAGGRGAFDLMDYPRRDLPRYRSVHASAPATVVRAEFRLSPEQVQRVEAELGAGVLRSHTVAVRKDYQNVRMWHVEANERAAVHHLVDQAGLPADADAAARAAATFDELAAILRRFDATPAASALLARLDDRYPHGLPSRIINGFLIQDLPRFLYFDDYSLMRGSIALADLRERRAAGTLDRADETFLSLLALAGLTLEELELERNYNRLKVALEDASAVLTGEIFKYWTQNRQLEVEFDIAEADPNALPPLNAGRVLHVRIRNTRHRVSLPFDDRSHGFVWFFSFLAYFSRLEPTGSVIVLLDEPGLALHPRAQRDLLRFIDDRLAPLHQVIYTTHSPFLISAAHLDRVRTVQDVDGRGTVIGADPAQNDRDTVFPLRAALAFELADPFFTGSHTLLVTHPSDVVYLELLADVIGTRGGDRLDPRWTIVPAGGAHRVASFVSLLGATGHRIAVLMDVAPAEAPPSDAEGLLARHVLPIRQFVRPERSAAAPGAELEDLFDPAFYVALVNGAYGAELDAPLVPPAVASGPVVRHVEQQFRERGRPSGFNRYRPARHLLLHQASLVPQLDAPTIERFAAVFRRLNELIAGSGSTS